MPCAIDAYVDARSERKSSADQGQLNEPLTLICGMRPLRRHPGYHSDIRIVSGGGNR